MPRIVRRYTVIAMLCLLACLQVLAAPPTPQAPAVRIELPAAGWTSLQADAVLSEEGGVQAIRLNPKFTYGRIGEVNAVVDKPGLRGAAWRFRATLSSETDFTVQAQVRQEFAHLVRPAFQYGTSQAAPANVDVVVDMPFYVPADATHVSVGLNISKNRPGVALIIKNTVLVAVAPAAKASTVDADLDKALAIIKSSAWRADFVNWPAVEALAYQVLGNVPTAESRRLAVGVALSSLADGHSFLSFPSTYVPASSGASMPLTVSVPPPRVVPKREAISAGHYLKPAPISSRLADESRDYTISLASAITSAAEGTCGWVVDLRKNPGGNMYPALDGLWQLFGDGPLGQFLSPKGNSGWRFEGGTSRTVRTADDWVNTGPARFKHSPVAVLIDKSSWSSAEALAISFIGRDHTRLFGSRSGGFTTANSFVEISPQVRFALAQAMMADRSGRTYPQGIDPDVVVPDAPLGSTQDPARQQAEVWVAQQCSAGK